MDKTPFSVYDFLAYLSSGSALLVAIDYVSGSQILIRKDNLPAQAAVLLIFAAYIVGQIVAHESSWLYENVLVRRILGSPIEPLLGGGKPFKLGTFLFPGYFRALPEGTRNRISAQTARRLCEAKGDALFLHCYVIATSQLDKLQSRLDDFRNQYGFARNVSCSLAIASVIVFVGWFWNPERVHFRWCIASLVCSVGLLYRYLKFFRQYTYELLIRYSELSDGTKDAL